MIVHVSRHAEDRLSQRLGLNRKAAKRYARLAFEQGVQPKDYYFEEIGKKWELTQERNKQVMYLFYKDCLHVFSLNVDREPLLVTLFDPTTEERSRPIYKAGKITKVKNYGREWNKR